MAVVEVIKGHCYENESKNTKEANKTSADIENFGTEIVDGICSFLVYCSILVVFLMEISINCFDYTKKLQVHK